MMQMLPILAALLLTHSTFAQGTIIFANRGGATTTAAPGQVLAPIYREDPADATHRISGNTSYNGAPFVAAGQGGTFIATLWGALSTSAVGDSANNNLQLLPNGTTSFGTAISGSSAGMVIPPRDPAPVPGVVHPSDHATFQVRVWDTSNGTLNTWEQLMLPENNGVLRGYSDLFTVPWPLGDTSLLGPPRPLSSRPAKLQSLHRP
jgi:hypothetical protein